MKHLHIIQSYILYYLKAKNKHDIHSPFVYDFICNVLNKKSNEKDFDLIQKIRKILYSNTNTITVEDFGAGSHTTSINERRICDIAKNAGRNEKFGKLLYQIIKNYNYTTAIELGTSLGLGTMYIASAMKNGRVITLEGSKNIAAVAKQNFEQTNLPHIEQIIGNFDQTLPQLLKNIDKVDLFFIDGNHRMEPTIRYFSECISHISHNGMMIFDDIHWSKEMNTAWQKIYTDDKVTLSIDLFYFGIVMTNTDFLEKQHFVLRY